MSLNQDFSKILTKLIEDYVTMSTLEKSAIEQNGNWGCDNQKNFFHGWFVGFVEGLCFNCFINTFNRKPNEEEKIEIVNLVRRNCYKIKEMIDRKFELAVVR